MSLSRSGPEFNVNTRVVHQPDKLSRSHLNRLANRGYQINLRTYLDLADAAADMKIDAAAHRMAFKTMSERCRFLNAALKKPDPEHYNALRVLEDRVRDLDKELSKIMLDLHEVYDANPERLYDFSWEALNSIQGSVCQMEDNFHIVSATGMDGALE